MLGGHSDLKDADDMCKQVTADVKAAVEQSTGKTYNTFTAVKFTSQVVNGINYNIKVQVDDGYIHVKAHRAPGADSKGEFKEVATGKTLEDGF